MKTTFQFVYMKGKKWKKNYYLPFVCFAPAKLDIKWEVSGISWGTGVFAEELFVLTALRGGWEASIKVQTIFCQPCTERSNNYMKGCMITVYV